MKFVVEVMNLLNLDSEFKGEGFGFGRELPSLERRRVKAGGTI